MFNTKYKIYQQATANETEEEQNGHNEHPSINSNGKTEVRSEQVEPTPDEHQVISFLDSLLASKKNMQQKAAPSETQYIKTEFDSSDFSPSSNGGEPSKNNTFDGSKPKAMYGVVGVHG